MTGFGYTLMTEQSGPKELVRYAQRAEEVGFDLAVSSDHYFPWLSAQGHAPYAWAVLGAVAHATERMELMTYVTCPTVRYHPAVVAQKAATLQILADGRFILGLGSGENLNEHVVGEGWPTVLHRQRMLREAIEIIRALHTGELVDWSGDYFEVDSARIWDLPDDPVQIAVAMGGERAVEELGPLADHLVATEPDASLVSAWTGLSSRRHPGEGGAGRGDGAGGGAEDGSAGAGGATRGGRGGRGAGRIVGQLPVSWDPSSVDAAVERAHDQFRWFRGGWDVNADLPTTAGFAAASQFVRPEDVAASIPCGPDLDGIVEAVRPFWEAGFTDVALVQVGDELQERFLDEAAGPLLEALRAAAPSGDDLEVTTEA